MTCYISDASFVYIRMCIFLYAMVKSNIYEMNIFDEM